VELGELRVDLARRRVVRDDAEVHLTPIEYDLLRTLVAHPGKVLTHKAIIQEVWGPGYGESHLLRVHIAALRRKIERNPRAPELIETVTGVGYRIREPEPRPEPVLPPS
jgi:two-component system KDP operon response regulator KdpE